MHITPSPPTKIPIPPVCSPPFIFVAVKAEGAIRALVIGEGRRAATTRVHIGDQKGAQLAQSRLQKAHDASSIAPEP